MREANPNMSALSKGLTDLAREAAYVAVGLGVLGVQRMQVHRVELQDKVNRDFDLEQRLDDVRHGVAKGWLQIDDLAESASQFVESTLQPFEERLPASVTQLTTKAREQARDVRTQIRQRVSA
jgi:hypothetical protein